jgi:hypothetical protein
LSKHDVARRKFLAGAALGAGVVASARLMPEASAQTHAQHAATDAAASLHASSNVDGQGAFLNEADAETVAAFTERLMPGAPGKPGARDAGCVRRSWYELASASLVRPKPSKQDGSESYGRHGNVGSGAWTAVGQGVGLTPEMRLLRRPSWRPHQRRQHIRSRYARGRMHRRGLRPGHVRTAHTGT